MKLYSLLDRLHICTTGERRIVSIKEGIAKSLIEKYKKSGYVIFSPSCFSSEDDSMMQLANLISEVTLKIRKRGFSYTPIYASFEKGEETIYEYALIIYPFDKSGNQQSFDLLQMFAIELTKLYNQDSLLIKTSVEAVDENVAFESVVEEYFTALHAKRASSEENTFKFIEAFINAAPSSLSGAHVRFLNGEKFISYR